MTQLHPNLQLIHRFFDGYANNDHSLISETLSPDIRWIIPGNHPWAGVKEGIENVLQYFKQLQQFDFKAESIVMGVNENYVIDCHYNWSNLEGKSFKNMSCLLWKIDNGKITEVYNFPQDQHSIDSFFNLNADSN